jgi:hypothetical protein
MARKAFQRLNDNTASTLFTFLSTKDIAGLLCTHLYNNLDTLNIWLALCFSHNIIINEKYKNSTTCKDYKLFAMQFRRFVFHDNFKKRFNVMKNENIDFLRRAATMLQVIPYKKNESDTLFVATTKIYPQNYRDWYFEEGLGSSGSLCSGECPISYNGTLISVDVDFVCVRDEDAVNLSSVQQDGLKDGINTVVYDECGNIMNGAVAHTIAALEHLRSPRTGRLEWTEVSVKINNEAMSKDVKIRTSLHFLFGRKIPKITIPSKLYYIQKGTTGEGYRMGEDARKEAATFRSVFRKTIKKYKRKCKEMGKSTSNMNMKSIAAPVLLVFQVSQTNDNDDAAAAAAAAARGRRR